MSSGNVTGVSDWRRVWHYLERAYLQTRGGTMAELASRTGGSGTRLYEMRDLGKPLMRRDKLKSLADGLGLAAADLHLIALGKRPRSTPPEPAGTTRT